jgi:hypothetical protein
LSGAFAAYLRYELFCYSFSANWYDVIFPRQGGFLSYQEHRHVTKISWDKNNLTMLKDVARTPEWEC